MFEHHLLQVAAAAALCWINTYFLYVFSRVGDIQCTVESWCLFYNVFSTIVFWILKTMERNGHFIFHHGTLIE